MVLNSLTNNLIEDHGLFTMGDALDEETLELGTVMDGPDQKDNQTTGEPTAKATKSDNARVPVDLWDYYIATELTMHWQKEIKLDDR